FLHEPATTVTYTLSLHDALPICEAILEATLRHDPACRGCALERSPDPDACRGSAVLLNFFRNRVLLLERLDLDLDDYLRWRRERSEEHTSELQSLRHLVCRLLLE